MPNSCPISVARFRWTLAHTPGQGQEKAMLRQILAWTVRNMHGRWQAAALALMEPNYPEPR